MASWIKNLTNVASSMGVKGAGKANQALEAGNKAGTAVGAVKWAVPAGFIIMILVLLSGLITGTSSAFLATQDPGSCVAMDPNELRKNAEEAGVTLTEEQLLGLKGGKGCRGSGIGYNGDTYPPTQGRITGLYAEIDPVRGGNPHTGLDIGASCDDPIYAFAGGNVKEVVMGTEAKSSSSGYVYPMGLIIIEHTPEFSTAYYHVKGSTTTVKTGDIVSAGDQIATQWSNGRSTGCHLHLEAYMNGKGVDPLPILQAAGYPYAQDYFYPESEFPPKPDGTGGGAIIGGTAPEAQSYARSLVKSKGWSDSEFTQCLLPLWNRESGWRVNALNPEFAPSQAPTPENQAYGIVQAAPGIKMATAGADWKTNPATQIRWGIGYIEQRYGTPCGAWAHSEQYNWY